MKLLERSLILSRQNKHHEVAIYKKDKGRKQFYDGLMSRECQFMLDLLIVGLLASELHPKCCCMYLCFQVVIFFYCTVFNNIDNIYGEINEDVLCLNHQLCNFSQS